MIPSKTWLWPSGYLQSSGLMGKKIGYYNIYAVAFILKIFILTTISRFRPMWFVFNIAHNFINLLSF